MSEDYEDRLIDIELGLVEAYVKIIIEHYPKLEKSKRDDLINGLESLVKYMLDVKREDKK